ncbi:MAG: SRPBCC domain-containing protein [Candidatus Lambdaproteobacteria bacterium]|nr:SRPBCC domain-containing protein [Candidatus Lambdaproteobacteria bacterium]
MAKTVTSSAAFPASPRTLYRMFLDAGEHGAAIGASARIRPRVGGSFSIWEGQLTGRTLLLKPGRMIVQSWRSSTFRADDPDSILVLTFSGDARQGRISLVHVNVPDHDAAGVKQGWSRYYWKPWQAYLAAPGGKGRRAPAPRARTRAQARTRRARAE